MKGITHIIEKYMTEERTDEILGIFKGDKKDKKPQSIIPKTARKIAQKYHSANTDEKRMNCLAGLTILSCAIVGTQAEQQGLAGLAIKISSSNE